MTPAGVGGRVRTTERWLGGRSTAERRLLWLFVVVGLVSLLGHLLLWPSYATFREERVRLRASRLSMSRLEELLLRRDEIMARAQRLVDDYLESQKLEPSSLLLQRLERDGQTRLVSLYPVGEDTDRGDGSSGSRWRAVLRSWGVSSSRWRTEPLRSA